MTATRRVVGSGLALIAYVALSVVFFHRAWTDPSHVYAGVGGDPEQTMWFFRWMAVALRTHTNPWFTTVLNYPHGVNMMWNTAEPLVGVVVAPLAAVVGMVAAYNVIVTASLALSAWCGHIAIYRVVPNRLAAWVGGLIYGWCPFMVGQAQGHLNLTVMVTPPLVFLIVHDVLIAQQRRWWVNAILLGLTVSAQLLIYEEVAALEMIVAIVAVTGLALTYPQAVRSRARPVVTTVAVGALLTCVICAWPLAVQFTGAQRLAGTAQPADAYASDPFNLVIPTDLQVIDPGPLQGVAAHFAGNLSETVGYLGLPLLGLLVLVIRRYWHVPVIRVSSAVMWSTYLLSLGPHLHARGHNTLIPLPWILVSHVPVIDSILPSRLMLFVSFMAGIQVAFALSQLSSSRGLRRVVVPALTGLSLLVLLPRPAPATAISVPTYFTTGAATMLRPGTPLLVLPLPWGREPGTSTEGMLWQETATLRFSMVAGYYMGPDQRSRVLRTLTVLGRDGHDPSVRWSGGGLEPSYREQMREELRETGADTIVLGPGPNHDLLAAFIADLMQRSPTPDDGVLVWSGIQTA